jgi:raffinose/stachyose/melibiose transport system substrate-binding protein
MDLFLQGQAAMFYMGSWAVANFNDPERNLIGAENVGFFPFPAVEGGAGDATQTPMNIGATTLWNAALYDDAAAQWLKTLAERYGDVALAEQGQVTGFVVTDPPAELPALTQLVTDQIAATTTSVTWFEQLFTARELSAAFQNVVPLVTGQLSAQDYMQAVADAGA